MNIVHVIGSGTIGEPLIGLLADHKDSFGIDEVTFYKRTPMRDEISKVNSLIERGAKLSANSFAYDDFINFGHKVSYDNEEALERATVVIDCTSFGNKNKESIYKDDAFKKVKGFIAQGSEKGFGKPYALNINDSSIEDSDRFIQVVSCNTHNISALIHTLGFYEIGNFPSRSIPGDYQDYQDSINCLEKGTFVCMRRANDISQQESFISSPEVSNHSDALYGTHHARDAHDIFDTMGFNLDLWSSAVKLNTQYMHALWFCLKRKPGLGISVQEAISRFEENKNIALTYKQSANKVFSFGRDHGYYGRILNQTVVVRESLAATGDAIVGFCFTPQEGNSLMSSVAASLRFIHPKDYKNRLSVLSPYLFSEI